MKKRFNYEHVNGARHGDMICRCCNRKIDHGWYRYREGPHGYIAHHRECSLGDPGWSRMAAEEDEQRRRNTELVQACIQFRDKWGVDELDEIIATGE